LKYWIESAVVAAAAKTSTQHLRDRAKGFVIYVDNACCSITWQKQLAKTGIRKIRVVKNVKDLPSELKARPFADWETAV